MERRDDRTRVNRPAEPCLESEASQAREASPHDTRPAVRFGRAVTGGTFAPSIVQRFVLWSEETSTGPSPTVCEACRTNWRIVMNKKIIIGAVAGAAAIAAISAARNKPAETAPKPSIWEKIVVGMEDMPKDFPLRVMLDSIEAIRVNSDRTVALLEQRQAAAPVANDGELIRTS